MSTPYLSPDESPDESLDTGLDESLEGTPELSLPLNKVFDVRIHNAHYPTTYMATLNMNLDTRVTPPKPVVAYEVVDLSNNNVVLNQSKVDITGSAFTGFQFQFALNPATQEQVAAGYITGTYTFTFPSPGSSVKTFGGWLSDPYPGNIDGTQDTWTATDNPGDSHDDEVS